MGPPVKGGKGKSKGGVNITGLTQPTGQLKQRVHDKCVHIGNLAKEMSIMSAEILRRQLEEDINTEKSQDAIRAAKAIQTSCQIFLEDN